MAQIKDRTPRSQGTSHPTTDPGEHSTLAPHAPPAGSTHGSGHVPNLTFASLEQVRPSRTARRFARLLCFVFLCVMVGVIFLPWQQTVVGRGQVTAYKPTERKQAVSAPISGLVGNWHVWEGSVVKVGDSIVDIVDPNPHLESDLKRQQEFLNVRIRQFDEQISRRREVIKQQTDSRDAQLKIAGQAIAVADQTVLNRKNAVGAFRKRYELAQREYELVRPLVEMGLLRGLDLIQREKAAGIAELEFRRSEADLSAAEETLVSAKAALPRIQADATRDINLSEQEIERLTGERNGIERDLNETQVRIKRYESRFVKAPCNGTVFRIEENAAQGGSAVKDGSVLCVIVPDTDDYIVELFIDGVDAPLIQRDADGRYPHVRIQFEGWPAVQFTGWPSAAYGTFGGRIRQIDQNAAPSGRFRVLVEPDELFSDDDWPSKTFLRQGNQAVGWVFLRRVTLGFELWRRLNGFPPIVAPEEPGKKKAK